VGVIVSDITHKVAERMERGKEQDRENQEEKINKGEGGIEERQRFTAVTCRIVQLYNRATEVHCCNMPHCTTVQQSGRGSLL
jgi:hypothetical protein